MLGVLRVCFSDGATVAAAALPSLGTHGARLHPPAPACPQVRNAARGKLKYIIGSGRNEMDWTYVGNVAQVGMGAPLLR